MAIFQHPSSEPEGPPALCPGSGPLAHRVLSWGQRQELPTLPPTLTPGLPHPQWAAQEERLEAG